MLKMKEPVVDLAKGGLIFTIGPKVAANDHEALHVCFLELLYATKNEISPA